MENRRGRPFSFGENLKDKKKIAQAILDLGTEAQVSTFHLKQLVEGGFVTAVKGDKLVEGRGRRPLLYVATEKGNRLASIALRVWEMAPKFKRIGLPAPE